MRKLTAEYYNGYRAMLSDTQALAGGTGALWLIGLPIRVTCRSPDQLIYTLVTGCFWRGTYAEFSLEFSFEPLELAPFKELTSNPLPLSF